MGSLATTAHVTREIVRKKSKTNLAARRLFHTRLFFPYLSEIGSKRKLSFGHQLLSNSVCVRKKLSVTQCPKFKARVSISVAINPVGDRDRNNLKTTVPNSGKSFFTVVYLVLCTSPDLHGKRFVRGIFTLVGFVSEISFVRCAHSFDFRYFTNSCENPVRTRFP